MKQPVQRTLTITFDGQQFQVMQTAGHFIQKIERIADIDLNIPDEWKRELKRTD